MSSLQLSMARKSPISRIAALGIAVAFALIASMLGIPAASASMTVRGQVMCLDQDNVTGVWIAASSGSGWASWSSINGYTVNFSRGGVSGSWTVHVGCGGTPSNWRYSPDGKVTVTSASASWTCYTPDIEAGADFCQHT
jgi:hypothetical protein